jgi:hypothetical protein
MVKTYQLELSGNDLDVLLIALIDHEMALKAAISDERVCTNNADTIETLTWHRIRIVDIMLQLKQQQEEEQ